MKRGISDFCALAALLALQLVSYRKVLRLWWLYDDTQLLHVILDHRLRDEFFSRAVWPQQLFTPLMFAAFEGQWASFGFDPSRWYAVHLAIAFVAIAAVYAAARLYLDTLPAFAAAALFLLGTPLCSLVAQLSTVHYFLAIAFGALAVIAFGKEWPWLSALFYFLALLSKEIAVPLPLVLAFLPARRRKLIPHVAALILYFVWRRVVIGAFLGAYSWSIAWNEWPRLLLAFPWRVVKVLAGANVYAGLALLALLVLLLLRARSWLLLAALVAAIGPMLPLVKGIDPRYPVMLWLVLAVAAAFALRRTPWALIALLVLAIGVNRQEWARETRVRQRMSDEGRFFMEMPADGFLRKPLIPPPNIRELSWLKANYFHQPFGTCFYDDLYLCTNDLRGRRVWEYEQRAVVEITNRLPTQYCSTIRWSAPLTAAFRHRGQVLRWELGPYRDGAYNIVLLDGREAWEVPRQDALNLPGLEALALRVRYDSPQGWTTYSPVIALDFTKQPDVTWRR